MNVDGDDRYPATVGESSDSETDEPDSVRTAGQRVLVLAHDLHVRVLTEHGDLVRDLTLDPTRNYQPQTKT